MKTRGQPRRTPLHPSRAVEGGVWPKTDSGPIGRYAALDYPSAQPGRQPRRRQFEDERAPDGKRSRGAFRQGVGRCMEFP